MSMNDRHDGKPLVLLAKPLDQDWHFDIMMTFLFSNKIQSFFFWSNNVSFDGHFEITEKAQEIKF